MRIYLNSALVCVAGLLLFRCAHSPLPRSVNSQSATAQPADPQAAPDSEALHALANQFNLFVNKKLSPAEEASLRTQCQQRAPVSAALCHVFENWDKLHEARRDKLATQRAAHSKRGTARFKMSGGKVLNWDTLKGAPVTQLIRGAGALSPMEQEKVRQFALNHNECPNNVAIALASHLEDNLPDLTAFGDVGALYEKGAQCITQNETDREILLSRAGLFYFAGTDYRRALPVFENAAKAQKTFVGRSLYWLYRTQAQLGREQQATETLELLKSRYPFAFHSLVAMTGGSYDPGTILARASTPITKRSVTTPALNPLLESVEMLWQYNFEAAASQVLNLAISESDGAEPEVVLYLAELKRDQGDYRGKISLLSDLLYNNPQLISRQTLELYFPKVYFPIFEKHGTNVDPYLLLAIARRESAFNARAVSTANARGLLQVLPKTSRRLLRNTNLFDPDTNVEAGSKYITELLQKLDGQVHLALAAYNAGPNRVTTWNQRYPVSDPILFIDLIPYRETREYVASVLRNYYWYRRLHKNPESLKGIDLLQLAISRQ